MDKRHFFPSRQVFFRLTLFLPLFSQRLLAMFFVCLQASRSSQRRAYVTLLNTLLILTLKTTLLWSVTSSKSSVPTSVAWTSTQLCKSLLGQYVCYNKHCGIKTHWYNPETGWRLQGTGIMYFLFPERFSKWEEHGLVCVQWYAQDLVLLAL